MSHSPGGKPVQPRAEGRGVEVRTADGELQGRANLTRAEALITAGLAVQNEDGGLRLKRGLRLISLRDNHPGERPDLTRMDQRHYDELWRGKVDARSGHGSLGRRTDNRSMSRIIPPRSPELPPAA